MKLRLKHLKLDAGRPIAFINEKDAEHLNVHVGERLEISRNGKKLIAIVDIVKGFIPQGDISLSSEIATYLTVKNNDMIDVGLSLEPKSSILIAKKLSGGKLSREDIFCIVKDIATNALTEPEIAYLISGVYEHGMNLSETIHLTEAIYKTGKIIHWGTNKIVDKHSIGGITGNRTTPIVVSICAATGVIIPKTSSRAITSASGTADVMETITKVDFSAEELKRIVHKTGACLAWGGALGLAPVDDKLIRIERLLNLDPESQLIASILAKKLAVGSKFVLIDIPYGEKAKVTKKKANNLKKKFMQVANHFNLKLTVILTEGYQPIGNGIGPVLEMIDVLKVLRRKDSPKDLEDKSILLAGTILEMIGKAKRGEGKTLARNILESGKAFKKFEEIISAQGKVSAKLEVSKLKHNIKSNKSGKIKAIDNRQINLLGRVLGCPTDKKAGIYLYKHVSDKVSKGELLMTLYSESDKKLSEAIRFLKETNPITIQ